MNLKILIKQAAVVLVALYCNQVTALANNLVGKTKCVSIGKLALSSAQKVSTQTLCQGERPALIPGQRYQFLCYSTTGIFNLIGAKATALPGCAPPAARRISCPTDTQASCTRKGPEESPNSPQMITPYGKVLMETRPRLSWMPTPGAREYIVKVKGPGEPRVNFGKSVRGNTTLSYPADAPPLSSGNVYTLTVVANQGGSSISSRKTITLLSQAAVQQIKMAQELVQRWKLPPDEAASTLDAVYMGQGLLDKAIEVLQARVSGGSQDPQIYQQLGNHYLEANLQQQAQVQYERAKQLGHNASDPAAIAQAEAGLQKIAQLRATRQLR